MIRDLVGEKREFCFFMCSEGNIKLEVALSRFC